MNQYIAGELLGRHEGEVTALAFNPQDTLLASGSADAKVKLWDVLNKKLLHTLTGHSKAITNVQFDRTGNILASASHDSSIKIWAPHTGKLLRSICPDEGAILSIEFCPCHDSLAVGCKENIVKLVNPVDGDLLNTIDEIESAVRTFAWSSDGRFLACSTDNNTVRVYDVNNWQPLLLIPCRTCSLKFSLNGSKLGGITDNGIILLWNTPDWSWGRQIYGNVNDNAIAGNQAITFNDTGDILACPSDTRINLFNPHSGEFLQSLDRHTGPVQTVAFNHAGSLLASGSSDKTIIIWKNKTLMRQMLALALALHPRCGQNSNAKILNSYCLQYIFTTFSEYSSFCDQNHEYNNIFTGIATFFLQFWMRFKTKCF